MLAENRRPYFSSLNGFLHPLRYPGRIPLPFEWTPTYWQGWRETSNPYRQFKSERDRSLTVEALQLRDGEQVLEVGCGYGWITEALFRSARIRWAGIDSSESMVEQLRARLSDYRPAASVGDARKIPFPSNSFDKVLSTGVLMHVPDEYAALKEMVRVLRPGGLLVCSMNNALSPYSVPVRCLNFFKTGFTQNFRMPRTYRRYLRQLGLRVQDIRGDGLCITEPLSFGRFSFPPKWAFSFLRSLDQRAVNRIPWLAYEIWFTAVKADG
jgi:SAM-dependent methyltransferase